MNLQRQDRRIFGKLIGILDKKKTSEKFPGEILLEIGKFFLGAPYVAGTLETKRPERLVVNLREFDCVTFVENVVALAWHVESGGKSFEGFRRLLRKIRYRQGRLQGYSARLHYFSDWVHDNQKKGIVKDITPEIGGRPMRKTLTFMSVHPDLYPQLKNTANFQKMKSVEKKISERSLCYISKKALRRLEDRIQDGDVIAITTNRESLDVQHVGLAARLKNRIHLLHATSKGGEVVLSPKTLYRYLTESRSRCGIMVARVRSARQGNS